MCRVDDDRFSLALTHTVCGLSIVQLVWPAVVRRLVTFKSQKGG